MDKIKENYIEQFLTFKDFLDIFETFFTLISSKLFFSDKFKDLIIQDEKSKIEFKGLATSPVCTDTQETRILFLSFFVCSQLKEMYCEVEILRNP